MNERIDQLYRDGTLKELMNLRLINPGAYNQIEICYKVLAYMATGMNKTEAVKETAVLVNRSEKTIWLALDNYAE